VLSAAVSFTGTSKHNWLAEHWALRVQLQEIENDRERVRRESQMTHISLHSYALNTWWHP